MIFSIEITGDCLKNKEVVCTFDICSMMMTIFSYISLKKKGKGDLTISYIVMAIIAIDITKLLPKFLILYNFSNKNILYQIWFLLLIRSYVCLLSINSFIQVFTAYIS